MKRFHLFLLGWLFGLSIGGMLGFVVGVLAKVYA